MKLELENDSLLAEVAIMKSREESMKGKVQEMEHRMQELSDKMLKSMLNLKKMALESRRSLNFTELEPKLLDLAAIVGAQNAYVVRLSVQNETLARSLHSKIQENDYQQAEIGAAIKQKDAAIHVLQEYVLNLAADLRDYQSQYSDVLQTHEKLKKDHEQLLAWQAHAQTRIANSEKFLDEREKEVQNISRGAMHLSLEVEVLR
ncbi:hypothetical protein M758_UG124300 [Ceratodon purpureus]|nr:hypothetical protein M758_UG124300 [Ceratodon purpureus]